MLLPDINVASKDELIAQRDELQAGNVVEDYVGELLAIQAAIIAFDDVPSSDLKLPEVKTSHIRVTGVMNRFARKGEEVNNSFTVSAVNSEGQAISFSANSNILTVMGYVIGDEETNYKIISVSETSDFHIHYDNQLKGITGYVSGNEMVAHTQNVKSARLQNLVPSLLFEGEFSRNEKVLDAKAEHVILKLNTAEFQKSVATFLMLFINNGVPADKAATAATAAATAQHAV